MMTEFFYKELMNRKTGLFFVKDTGVIETKCLENGSTAEDLEAMRDKARRRANIYAVQHTDKVFYQVNKE